MKAGTDTSMATALWPAIVQEYIARDEDSSTRILGSDKQ